MWKNVDLRRASPITMVDETRLFARAIIDFANIFNLQIFDFGFFSTHYDINFYFK